MKSLHLWQIVFTQVRPDVMPRGIPCGSFGPLLCLFVSISMCDMHSWIIRVVRPNDIYDTLVKFHYVDTLHKIKSQQ
jgi:hypothetical protein